jgi:hypothetical protein
MRGITYLILLAAISDQTSAVDLNSLSKVDELLEESSVPEAKVFVPLTR